MTEASKPRVLVTGCAGFIGMHVADRLLREGAEVLGVDSLNAYYEPQLKQDRLAQLRRHAGFTFEQRDLAAHDDVLRLVADYRPAAILHFAAQAGVRYSVDNPRAYASSNLDGFLAVLEACRHTGVKRLIYASSSSVYGDSATVPFSEAEAADRPVSLYAATKRANELMAHSYAHLYGIEAIGLRLFTVYGAWGRPDMAYYKFTRAILEGRPIDVYNGGRLRRDFTYIDDVVEAVMRLLALARVPTEASDDPPHRVFNVGHQHPVPLADFIGAIERAVGRTAEKHMLGMQPGDVKETWADVSALQAAIGFAPATSLEQGLPRFVRWYRAYYGVE